MTRMHSALTYQGVSRYRVDATFFNTARLFPKWCITAVHLAASIRPALRCNCSQYIPFERSSIPDGRDTKLLRNLTAGTYSPFLPCLARVSQPRAKPRLRSTRRGLYAGSAFALPAKDGNAATCPGRWAMSSQSPPLSANLKTIRVCGLGGGFRKWLTPVRELELVFDRTCSPSVRETGLVFDRTVLTF